MSWFFSREISAQPGFLEASGPEQGDRLSHAGLMPMAQEVQSSTAASRHRRDVAHHDHFHAAATGEGNHAML